MWESSEWCWQKSSMKKFILEEADFPNILCTYLERVGLRFYLLRPSRVALWFLCRIDYSESMQRSFQGLRLTKCQTGQNTWQTSQIESKGSPISQNISKKLIILSNAQRAHPRGAAGRSKFHLKENRHTQEMAPEVQPLSVMRPSGRGGTGCLCCGPGYFCWLHLSWLLLLPWASGSTFENQFKLLLSSLPSRVVMRNWWKNGCDSIAFAMIRSNKTRPSQEKLSEPETIKKILVDLILLIQHSSIIY